MDAYRPENWRLFSAGPVALVAVLALVGGCKPPPDARGDSDATAEEKGLALIEATGCGACHEIPGVPWPRGRLGPSLEGFGDRGLIAGKLPKTPANLAAFIRNAPEVEPGSTMPRMPLNATEAADIAAYLLGMRDG